jgi:glutamate racemase
LVLGCTHYVFVQAILQKMVGPKVQLISTGEAVAKQTHRLSDVHSKDFIESAALEKKDAIQLWTTGPLSALEHAAKRWLGLSPAHCHWIGPTQL